MYIHIYTYTQSIILIYEKIRKDALLKLKGGVLDYLQHYLWRIIIY